VRKLHSKNGLIILENFYSLRLIPDLTARQVGPPMLGYNGNEPICAPCGHQNNNAVILVSFGHLDNFCYKKSSKPAVIWL